MSLFDLLGEQALPTAQDAQHFHQTFPDVHPDVVDGIVLEAKRLTSSRLKANIKQSDWYKELERLHLQLQEQMAEQHRDLDRLAEQRAELRQLQAEDKEVWRRRTDYSGPAWTLFLSGISKQAEELYISSRSSMDGLLFVLDAAEVSISQPLGPSAPLML